MEFKTGDIVRVVLKVPHGLPVGMIGIVIMKCDCAASRAGRFLHKGMAMYAVHPADMKPTRCMPGFALKKIDDDEDGEDSSEPNKRVRWKDVPFADQIRKKDTVT